VSQNVTVPFDSAWDFDGPTKKAGMAALKLLSNQWCIFVPGHKNASLSLIVLTR